MVTTNINNNKSINNINKNINYFNNNDNNILLNEINNHQRMNQIRINDIIIGDNNFETTTNPNKRFFKFLSKLKKGGSNNDTIQVHCFTPYCIMGQSNSKNIYIESAEKPNGSGGGGRRTDFAY
ncbi:hypothetical protein RB653_008205 [Dictyostelium firmibasis]|uniref:Uncharacterized protein n=1 Tax=Dictyostelium firmibasis TaxID=79012 RepID=A0AAN7TZD0_9MYCE